MYRFNINIFNYFVRTERLSLNTCIHNLNLIKRNAGHSKWANIKHIKAAKDAQKSIMFKKMQQFIQGGGTDPNFNARLASTIEQAKRYNMPAATIKNAIEQCKASNKGDGKSVYYELRGPGGCTIIVCILSDNIPKTRANINTIVRKCNASYTEGSVPAIFEHKGLVQAEQSDSTPLEKAVEHAIEIGAEDVTEEETEEDGKILQFLCEPALLNQVKGKLVKLGYTIKNADNEFLPKIQVTLNDNDLENVNKLFDKLNDDPDVVKLYDNIS
ncbi:Translational activator of cytochrome c oxidase 1 [Blattella germanica]|nr:Translational activator of cytochrome c oxidase 1 [Blattella germanica]